MMVVDDRSQELASGWMDAEMIFDEQVFSINRRWRCLDQHDKQKGKEGSRGKEAHEIGRLVGCTERCGKFQAT
jgi:hypothetical protein